METLVIIIGAAAFVLALLEAYVDIRRIKPALALVITLGFSAPLHTWSEIVRAIAAAFFATFLVALAGRVVAMPLAVSRPVGQRD